MDLLISDEFRGREGAEMTGTRDAVLEYINNQYRLFGLLDRYLQRPTGPCAGPPAAAGSSPPSQRNRSGVGQR